MTAIGRCLACGLLLFCTAASAGWQAEVPGARVVGAGPFNWFGFKVYEARLWSSGQPLAADQPFALELTYQRRISRDDLVEASLDEIKRLSGTRVSPAQLADWRQQMQLAFVDVTPGQRITGVYLPGRGAQFFVDQRLQHAVTDSAFAQAFFAIWLDPRTRNPQLRAQLLGQ